MKTFSAKHHTSWAMGYSRARSTAVVILLLLAYASTTVDARSKVQGRKALRSQVYEGKALSSQKKFMGLSSALEAAGSSVSVVAAGSSYIVDSASGAAALLKDQAVINLQDLILKTVKPVFCCIIIYESGFTYVRSF
jgi:hypothetical protein